MQGEAPEVSTSSAAGGEELISEELQKKIQEDPGSVIVESVLKIWDDFLVHLPLLVVGFVVLLLTWLIANIVGRIVRWSMSKSNLRSGLKSLFGQLIQIVIWVVGLMIVAIIIFPGMTPSKAITVLGLGSVAIGFAFKDIFENFFAGIFILWKFPFDPGDYIACGDNEGEVQDIDIRMTTIRQVDGQLITLPNAQLFKEPVRVMTHEKHRRMSVVCGVSYDTPLDKAIDVLQKAVDGCKLIDQSRGTEVFAQQFGSSSIDFLIRWWANPRPVDEVKTRSEVIFAIKSALDAAEIEIPFPYRTMTFKEPLSIQRTAEDAEGIES
ncbi:mechanosensitive ion channel family protein [Rubinisphaera italica]|uniref:Small-conductance mechanosensitive channel n=1 Tax=Rubinisphaera italica TaxID=2527969 RepID=A0A5C5XKI0_9PLAN|nr:mechanosensitive ion channel family protein [Rubinisphaera italica]TWT63440.1 Small-conductance mechanosensitive channel [Rubinisphaera italica]